MKNHRACHTGESKCYGKRRRVLILQGALAGTVDNMVQSSYVLSGIYHTKTLCLSTLATTLLHVFKLVTS